MRGCRVAIENHPKFLEWSMAFDRLYAARIDYITKRALPKFGDADAAEAELWSALAAYNKISSEIDNA